MLTTFTYVISLLTEILQGKYYFQVSAEVAERQDIFVGVTPQGRSESKSLIRSEGERETKREKKKEKKEEEEEEKGLGKKKMRRRKRKEKEEEEGGREEGRKRVMYRMKVITNKGPQELEEQR